MANKDNIHLILPGGDLSQVVVPHPRGLNPAHRAQALISGYTGMATKGAAVSADPRSGAA